MVGRLFQSDKDRQCDKDRIGMVAQERSGACSQLAQLVEVAVLLTTHTQLIKCRCFVAVGWPGRSGSCRPCGKLVGTRLTRKRTCSSLLFHYRGIFIKKASSGLKACASPLVINFYSDRETGCLRLSREVVRPYVRVGSRISLIFSLFFFFSIAANLTKTRS